MPAIQSFYDKQKSKGLEVLAISMDDPRDVADVRKIAQTFNFPIALKTDADFKGLGRIWLRTRIEYPLKPCISA